MGRGEEINVVETRREAPRFNHVNLILIFLLAVLLAGCAEGAPAGTPTVLPTIIPTETRQPTRTATLTVTPAPTWTPSPSPTLTPTITPTLAPAAAGTALPTVSAPILQVNLMQVRLLAEWGRGRVDGLAWSPTGGLIAVSTPLGIYLYNPADLDAPLRLDTGGAAAAPLFSPEGRYLAADVFPAAAGGGPDAPEHRVQVWNLAAPDLPRIAELETGGQTLAMAFAGEELRLLVRTGQGAQYQRWRYQEAARIQTINLSGGEAAVWAAISPAQELAAVRGDSGPVRLWRLSDGLNLATTNEPVSRGGPLAFSADGGFLAAGYSAAARGAVNGNRVRVWRVPAQAGALFDLAFELAAPSGAGTLLSLAWAPDGGELAAGYGDLRTFVWRVRDGRAAPVYRELAGESLPRFLAWAPAPEASEEAPRLATGGLEVWRIGALGGKPERLASTDDFLPGIFDMQFSPDGGSLALAGYERIDIRAVASGQRALTLRGMAGAVNGVAYSPDGKLLAAACQDGTARLYLAANGLYLDILGQPTYAMRAVDFSDDGRWVASSSESGLVQIYRVKDGVLMYGLEEPFLAYKLRFAPNSDQLATLTTSGVRLRGIFATEEVILMDWESWIGGVGLSDLAYSPGEEFLALVGNDVVRVVEPLSGETVYSIYEPGGALPWAAAFSPDNAFLAVGWSDGQVRLYWAQDGRLMRAWQAHPASVRRLVFRKDGRLLATLGEEGAIRIWGVSE